MLSRCYCVVYAETGCELDENQYPREIKSSNQPRFDYAVHWNDVFRAPVELETSRRFCCWFEDPGVGREEVDMGENRRYLEGNRGVDIDRQQQGGEMGSTDY